MTPIDTEVTVDSVYCDFDCDGFKSGCRISVVRIVWLWIRVGFCSFAAELGVG